MLIDWLSLSYPITSDDDLQMVKGWQSEQDRLVRIAGDGSIVWETSAWESVRSDSHQLAFQVTGSYIRIQGSPARIIGCGDNVFSSGAAAALDLVGCQQRMVSFVSGHTGLSLPDTPKKWRLTRVDVTENLYLGDLPSVRQALAILRDCEGGRYRVSQQAGDTVYWSHRSRLRSGKAYAKGAEIASKMIKKGKQHIEQSSRDYSINEIAMTAGLLRLELKLGAQYWRERALNPWYLTPPDALSNEWRSYFARMIGGAEIMKEDDVLTRIKEVTETDGQFKAAYSLWCLIKSEGWQKARDITTKRTWYRNLKFLKNAGLSDADISAGNVVQLRQKVLEARPVTNWGDLHELFSNAA